MGAEAIIQNLHQRGMRIMADGDRLIVEGTLTDQDRAAIRSHKPQIMHTVWWRFAIRMGRQYIEVDYPSGATLEDAIRQTRQWYGEDATVEPMIGLQEARRRPDDMGRSRIAVIKPACNGPLRASA